MDFVIEIATSDFASTRNAVAGGADRIELCADLAEGGTTPSFAQIKQCRERFSIPIFPIIRPRAGDFLYDDDEFSIMLEDTKLCRQLGCDGIVTGLLNADGNIDKKRTAMLVETAYPLELTFHRAFDRCIDPFAAMETLIDIGCQRILTSGQRPTAPEGIELIRALQSASANRILIMPGSGVRASNIAALAKETGCNEFHSSLREMKSSQMSFVHPSFAGDAESYSSFTVEAEKVRALRNALQE